MDQEGRRTGTQLGALRGKMGVYDLMPKRLREAIANSPAGINDDHMPTIYNIYITKGETAACLMVGKIQDIVHNHWKAKGVEIGRPKKE